MAEQHLASLTNAAGLEMDINHDDVVVSEVSGLNHKARADTNCIPLHVGQVASICSSYSGLVRSNMTCHLREILRSVVVGRLFYYCSVGMVNQPKMSISTLLFFITRVLTQGTSNHPILKKRLLSNHVER